MNEVPLPLLTALITGVVSLFGGYLLGNRRIRYERLYEKRGEVIAELSRLLTRLQISAMRATRQGKPLQYRQQNLQESRETLTDLVSYLHAHIPWLPPLLSERINDFQISVSQDLKDYEASLDQQGNPIGDIGVRAAEHIAFIVPDAKEVLENEFRAILYPAPWWDAPLRFFAWLDAQLKHRQRS